LAIICFPYLKEPVVDEKDLTTDASSDSKTVKMEVGSDPCDDDEAKRGDEESKTSSFNGEMSVRPSRATKTIKSYEFTLDEDSVDEADEDSSNDAASLIPKDKAKICSKMYVFIILSKIRTFRLFN
jgi:hypothetical protein